MGVRIGFQHRGFLGGAVVRGVLQPALGTGGSVSAQAAFDAGLSLEPRANEFVIDEAARADYKQRITELEQVIDDANGAGDAETRAKARQELDALSRSMYTARQHILRPIRSGRLLSGRGRFSTAQRGARGGRSGLAEDAPHC
jgi:hypothetical protein